MGKANGSPLLVVPSAVSLEMSSSPSLTVTLPWSQLNQYLSYMGAIVVAFAMVFAARIVVGAR